MKIIQIKDELELTGKFSIGKIFTTNINEETIAQVTRLLDHPFSEGSTIRIMPDTHIGKGAVVGTTMTYLDKIVPDVVGVDIGCGMYAGQLAKGTVRESDLRKLDKAIQKEVPSGTGVRRKPHPYLDEINIEEVRAPLKRQRRSELSVGSLGGGNHFIELNEDEKGNHYLVIHSGSRSLGHDIATYYQKKAVQYWKHRGNQNEEGHNIDPEFAYLIEEDMEDYLHDVQIAQAMNWEMVRTFDTVHNYVDIPNRIIRKGAISAQKGEEILVPINMRDGSILAIGRGNPDWNYSAPHGAGRLLSRTQARKELKMEQFIQAMEGIYTTSVRTATLDEAPFAYKPMEEILERTADTFTVKALLKPIYNFKA